MSKNFIHTLILVFISLYLPAFSQNAGKVIEGKTINSKILSKNISYSIYLPADYETSSTRRFPVVYLLHGYSDNETAWVQFGNVNQTADKLIATGEITPMIIVMPNGELNWYVNSYDNKVRWMDMFIQEFISSIDKEYRTRASGDYRAISGLSMGGYGSFMTCLKYPTVIKNCAALSAAIWTSEKAFLERADDFVQPFWPKNSNDKEEIFNYYKNYNVLELIKNAPIDSLQKVRWYFDCGDKDFITDGNALLHVAMNERKLKHEYRVSEGYHNWQYWRDHIGDALKFITKGFDRRN